MLGLCFMWTSMLVQVVCGAVSGLGPFLLAGSPQAIAQVLVVSAVKLLWACILWRYSPCACMLTNAVLIWQSADTFIHEVANASAEELFKYVANPAQLVEHFEKILEI